MSDPGIGRSRGRARGRAQPVPLPQEAPPVFDVTSLQQSLPTTGQQRVDTTVQSVSGDDNGNGNGNGSATLRGRGGYHSGLPPIRTRPPHVTTKTGTNGTPVELLANYFQLKAIKNIVIYDYHISYEPQIESSFMRRAILYNQAVRDAFRDRLEFDGMSNLKSTTLLPAPETDFFAVRNTDGTNVRIRVKLVGEIGFGHNEMLRLFNTQMRKYLRFLEWKIVGRHYFNMASRKEIPEHKLELLQGLFTAINIHDGGSNLMVADVVHKVIRTDSVLQNLKNIYRSDQNRFNTNARRELTGSIVMTKYNQKTYRIDDIAFDKNPSHQFEKNGISMSLVDYYQQQYGIRITDNQQPLLIALPNIRQQRSGQSGQILLVPEICYMTGISDSMANDFRIRKSLTEQMQQEPRSRVQHLRSFIQSLNQNQKVKDEQNKWGIEFDNNLVQLKGRVLPLEQIVVSQNRANQRVLHKQGWDQKSGDFSKDIRSMVMYSPTNINKWLIINSPRDQGRTQEFADTLNRVFHPMGVALSRPEVRILDNDRTSTYVEASRNLSGYQIIVVILPNNNKDRYDAIKKIFCCDNPMASQMVVARTLGKGMSAVTKIGIQMACKVGAQPWALDIPPKNLMVVGFDVHRDSAQRERAMGAFVCSINPTLTKFYSCVSPHQNREELSNNLKNHLKSGLKSYFNSNKTPPQTIVIYRDGVGEGDIDHVYNYELKQIEEAIKEIFNNITIKLCFVIVTKRINSRFFLKTQVGRQTDYNNPIPGTVADSVVTRDERFDFYLISQSVRQGTVTPTMYNIIRDDTNWAPHLHQMLAFKLTHLFYNWIGTIRVPAPCQYAHKLAYLTGTSLHRSFHSHLAESLFYL